MSSNRFFKVQLVTKPCSRCNELSDIPIEADICACCWSHLQTDELVEINTPLKTVGDTQSRT